MGHKAIAPAAVCCNRRDEPGFSPAEHRTVHMAEEPNPHGEFYKASDNEHNDDQDEASCVSFWHEQRSLSSFRDYFSATV